MAMKLTGKQEKYCQLRAQGMNMSEAYRKAYDASNMKGPTVNNKAYELERKGEIAERIKELQAPAIKKIEVDLEYTLGVIHETIERCRQNIEPVLLKGGVQAVEHDEEGNVRPVFAFDAKAVLKGADMLMKYNGGYEKHNKQQNQNNLLIAFGKLPENVLNALIERIDGYPGRPGGSRPHIEGTAARLS